MNRLYVVVAGKEGQDWLLHFKYEQNELVFLKEERLPFAVRNMGLSCGEQHDP